MPYKNTSSRQGNIQEKASQKSKITDSKEYTKILKLEHPKQTQKLVFKAILQVPHSQAPVLSSIKIQKWRVPI